MSKAKYKGKRKQKQEEEKDNLAYKVLSAEHTKELLEEETVEDVQNRLATILGLTHNSIDLREASQLDYYTASFWWARQQGYNSEQSSAFFTVVHNLLINVKDKHMGMIENLKEYKKMLIGIGQETPDANGGLDCFDVTQAKTITDYLSTSLFQHYKLYEFMFSTTQAEEIIGTDLSIEVATAADHPWPPPLEEGVDEEIHNQFICPPPVEETAEEEKAEEPESKEDEEEAGESEEQLQKEADLLSQLTQDEVKAIMSSVFDEMLTGLKEDVAQKLRDKENSFLQRINKLHVVANK